MLPTQEEIHKYFIYIPETGVFLNRITRSNQAKEGHQSGCVDQTGYIYIYFKMTRLLAHRMAWMYMYGIEPDGQIDHINGDRTDNRIANLRVSTAHQNARNRGLSKNSSTGFKNISWNAERGSWEVSIKMNGKKAFFKRFKILQEAQRAAISAREELHGEFANHG